MKKILITVLSTSLSLLAWTSTGHAIDKDQAIADQLNKKGLQQVKSVHTELDVIHDIDKNNKAFVHPAKKTLIVDLRYSSIQEANNNYGQAIAELSGQKNFYTRQVGADYLKVNIYKGEQLVAYYAVMENGERMYHINGGFSFSSLGMGFPMPRDAYQHQLEIIKNAENKNI